MPHEHHALLGILFVDEVHRRTGVIVKIRKRQLQGSPSWDGTELLLDEAAHLGGAEIADHAHHHVGPDK